MVSRRVPFAALIVSLLFVLGAADPPPGERLPSAADMVERTLDDQGLAAALDSLQVALADSGRSYEIDAYDLGIGLPARLVVQYRREEALAILERLEPLFGDHPRYWQELGQAHLRCAHADEARRAFDRAVEMSPDRADLLWMAENIEELVANARLQAEREDHLEPGAATCLMGPYLGQTPPGVEPEVFAPGLVSTTAHEYHVSIAPDGREIIFSRSRVGSLVTRLTEDGWTVPEVIHLIDADHLTEEANHTPDGEGVVFCGRADVKRERDLYYAAREGDRWGEPVKLFPGMYGTTTLDGALYYTARGEGRDYGAIVRCEPTADGFGEPVPVAGEGINTEYPDAHPWISPDEDLLVFDSYRDPGMGLYASFKGEDGRWRPAVPLCDKLDIPPVGQAAMSPDGKYLFFCMAGDIYWVDAEFMEEFRPEHDLQ